MKKLQNDYLAAKKEWEEMIATGEINEDIEDAYIDSQDALIDGMFDTLRKQGLPESTYKTLQNERFQLMEKLIEKAMKLSA